MWCKVLDSETLELDFGIEQSGDFAVGALRDDSVKFSESFGMVPGEVTRIKGIKSIRELFGGAVLVFALDENKAVHIPFWHAYEKKPKAAEAQAKIQATPPRKTTRYVTRETGRTFSLSLVADFPGRYRRCSISKRWKRIDHAKKWQARTTGPRPVFGGTQFSERQNKSLVRVLLTL